MDATSPGDAPQLSLRNWCAPVQAASEAVPGFVWLEAEGFRDYGKWHLDTQFVHKMGSAYLLAAAVGTPVKDAAEARALMDDYLKAGGSADSENYKDAAALLDNADATQSQLDKALGAMLAEVGKTLPQPEKQRQDPSVYKFEYVENIGDIAASTPMPTREPGSTPAPADNAKNDKAARNAAIIAGGALAAAAIAIGVTAAVRSKKRKAKG